MKAKEKAIGSVWCTGRVQLYACPRYALHDSSFTLELASAYYCVNIQDQEAYTVTVSSCN